MSNQDKTQPTPTKISLARAINLAKSGEKAEAVAMLRKIVATEPRNQAAWIWLSAVAPEQVEAEAALRQAKQINPQHASLGRAEQWVVRRFSRQQITRPQPPASKMPPPAPPPDSAPQTGRNWLSVINAFAFGVAILVVLIGLIVLFFGLFVEMSGAAAQVSSSTPLVVSVELRRQLDEAWAAKDWPAAITALESLKSAAEPGALDTQLAQAHFNYGQSLRNRGFVAEANQQFEQALQLAPALPNLQREAKLSAAYAQGTALYQQGQWPQAITALEPVWAEDKNYINARDLLYSAHYNHALAQQAAGQFAAAQQSLRNAIRLRPDLSDPRRLLAELDFATTPGTRLQSLHNGPVEERLILVGIAEQRMKVFDGDKLVFDFVVSTGEPGRDTAVGEFEILDKIDMAYASTWNLDMPYWMGIYWAGPLENGIHALPVVKHTGYKLWDGYLGQRVSYGCVILGDEDAATLFEWTEVGTKVKIVPSLAGWSPADR